MEFDTGRDSRVLWLSRNQQNLKYLPQLTLIMSTSLLKHFSITLISVVWGGKIIQIIISLKWK